MEVRDYKSLLMQSGIANPGQLRVVALGAGSLSFFSPSEIEYSQGQ